MGKYYSSIAESDTYADSKPYAGVFAIRNSCDAGCVTDFDVRISNRVAQVVAPLIRFRRDVLRQVLVVPCGK